MDGDLELVGGVEGDLDQLLLLSSVVHHVAIGQLCALEDRRLRRIAVHIPLQDAHLASIIVCAMLLIKKKSHLVLASLGLSPVAEHDHPLESLPARSRLVDSVAGLVLGRVRLHNLVVEPHVQMYEVEPKVSTASPFFNWQFCDL